MNAGSLVRDLRNRGVVLEASGDLLNVDAPAGVVDEQTRELLSKNKPEIIKVLERERRRIEEADRRGLVIKWAKERGWITLHDPTTGGWHEVRASDCLPWVMDAANAHRRDKGGRTG